MRASKPGSDRTPRTGTVHEPLDQAPRSRLICRMAGALAGGVAGLFCLCLTLGCGVNPPGDTGGTDAQPGACGRGVVVVNTDYQSTNVSLVDIDGQVLSSSFISSASGSTGLSAPLGGDVTAPTQSQEGQDIVLIDRYPASVLTWVDVHTGEPDGQLSVATGFAANPRDFLVVSPGKAYVSRYDPNFDAGHEHFDEGNDLLAIDPTTKTILDRVDMQPAMDGAPQGFFAHPDKLLMVGDRMLVLLGAYTADFTSSAPSRVATVDLDTNRVVDSMILEGMHGCTAMARSPAGDEVAVACSGEFAGDSVSTLAESGIVLLSVADGLMERRRFPASTFETGPVSGAIAYASDTHIVFTTFGQFEEGGMPYREDAFLQLQIDSGAFDVILRSTGSPFSLGDVRCASACDVCFLADASPGIEALHRFRLGRHGEIEEQSNVIVDREVGLPPRNLGWF